MSKEMKLDSVEKIDEQVNEDHENDNQDSESVPLINSKVITSPQEKENLP